MIMQNVVMDGGDEAEEVGEAEEHVCGDVRERVRGV